MSYDMDRFGYQPLQACCSIQTLALRTIYLCLRRDQAGLIESNSQEPNEGDTTQNMVGGKSLNYQVMKVILLLYF